MGSERPVRRRLRFETPTARGMAATHTSPRRTGSVRPSPRCSAPSAGMSRARCAGSRRAREGAWRPLLEADGRAPLRHDCGTLSMGHHAATEIRVILGPFFRPPS